MVVWCASYFKWHQTTINIYKHSVFPGHSAPFHGPTTQDRFPSSLLHLAPPPHAPVLPRSGAARQRSTTGRGGSARREYPKPKVAETWQKWRSGWWFGTFFIFPYIGKNHPNGLILFRGVQTTNQFGLVNGCQWHFFHLIYPLWFSWIYTQWMMTGSAGVMTMGVSIVIGLSQKRMVYFMENPWKSHQKMDDDWGYHHFRKPPNGDCWCVLKEILTRPHRHQKN